MNVKTHAELNIDGTPIPYFTSLEIRQRFNAHHEFTLQLNHEVIEQSGTFSLQNSREFVGKGFTAVFGNAPGKENVFNGLITRVEFSQGHGSHGDVFVRGYSPTILLDRGPDLGSYLGKSLDQIVQQASGDAPSGDLRMQVNPAHKAPLDYIIQYRESDFDFINRLSAQYYEWFFYDGYQIHFGKPDELKKIDLVYGRDLNNLQYSLQVAPLKYRKFAYHSGNDKLMSAESSGSPSGPADLQHVISAANLLYSKTYSQPMPVRVDSQQDIDSFVKHEEKARTAEMMQVSGNGNNPQLALGSIAQIQMSKREGSDFTKQSFGSFLITSVLHRMDGVGHYHNTFEGISGDTERIQVQDVYQPRADVQLADVVDNNDPDGQGRIKVQFKWACSCNDSTEWLRVVSPSAGSGDTGGNRGYFVIPEKGDQVVVAFEEGNTARPVVLGSVYSGKSAKSDFSNSDTKAMNSRAGSTLTFDDGNHAVMLQTDDSNSIKVEKSGNKITLTADDEIELKTGESKLTMKKDGTIELNGKQKLTLVGQDTGVDVLSEQEVLIVGRTKASISSETLVETLARKVTIAGENHVELQGTKLDMDGSAVCNIRGGETNINCAV